MRLRPSPSTFALLLLLAGCGGTTTLSVPVLGPARVPVRAFPIIFVASADGAEELVLRGSLAMHLAADGRARVEEVPFASLEPRRLAGQIPAPSVVVVLRASSQRSVRQDWGSRPITVCGPMGCYTQMETYTYEVPVLALDVEVTVHDGPTATLLQRETLSASDQGRDEARMRERILAQLVPELQALVDAGVQSVEVPLFAVDVPGVEEAIAAIAANDWARGRALLEQAALSPERASLRQRDGARLLYDLAMARRFDPTTLADAERHFAEAEAALRAAQRADPQALYERALADLDSHRQAQRELERQARAAEHNYALVGAPATAPAAVPSPPGS